jgi:2-polyprenyl-6-methoxyphenol hydroxylase-like FAD-dependent oxidoreductase
LLSFRSPLLTYDRRDIAQQKDILARTFNGLGWHAEYIVDAMRKADDFYFDSTSRVVVPQWSRGRIALLGDAGYCGSPLAGHGTALSLVGAYVLAGELAVADGNHLRAFGAYQEQMQAYVDQRTQLPPGGIRMAMPMTSAGIWLRNAFTRLMTSRPLRGMVAKAAVQPDAISLVPYAGQVTPARPSRG